MPIVTTVHLSVDGAIFAAIFPPITPPASAPIAMMMTTGHMTDPEKMKNTEKQILHCLH